MLDNKKTAKDDHEDGFLSFGPKEMADQVEKHLTAMMLMACKRLQLDGRTLPEIGTFFAGFHPRNQNAFVASLKGLGHRSQLALAAAKCATDLRVLRQEIRGGKRLTAKEFDRALWSAIYGTFYARTTGLTDTEATATLAEALLRKSADTHGGVNSGKTRAAWHDDARMAFEHYRRTHPSRGNGRKIERWIRKNYPDLGPPLADPAPEKSALYELILGYLREEGADVE